MKPSGILLLTICSNGKQSGGDRSYITEGSVPSMLPDHSTNLIQARQRIFQLIKSGTASRMGAPLSHFPHNSHLADGPDFGGSASAEYMPSAARFRGRFYRELGQMARIC
jgi:hypothetical protein